MLKLRPSNGGMGSAGSSPTPPAPPSPAPSQPKTPPKNSKIPMANVSDGNNESSPRLVNLPSPKWKSENRRAPQPRQQSESIEAQVLSLTRILNTTYPEHSSLTTPRFHDWTSQIDCDEVYPGIYIGNSVAAENIKYLKQIGVTHVVNTAEGTDLGQVKTGASYYADAGIKYLGLPLSDVPGARIDAHFMVAAEFIDVGLKEGGRVLVHCFMGISRSATIAIAYLMIKKKISAEDALSLVRRQRCVRPNDGFLKQLAILQEQLKSGNIAEIGTYPPPRSPNYYKPNFSPYTSPSTVSSKSSSSSSSTLPNSSPNSKSLPVASKSLV